LRKGKFGLSKLFFLLMASCALVFFAYANLSSVVGVTLDSPLSGIDFNASSEVFLWNVTSSAVQNINCTLHGNWTTWSVPQTYTYVNASLNLSYNFSYPGISGPNGTLYMWAVRCHNMTDAGDVVWSGNETFKILVYVDTKAPATVMLHRLMSTQQSLLAGTLQLLVLYHQIPQLQLQSLVCFQRLLATTR